MSRHAQAPCGIIRGVSLATLVVVSAATIVHPAAAPDPRRFASVRTFEPEDVAPLSALRMSGVSRRAPDPGSVRRTIQCGTKSDQASECVADRLDAEASLVQAALWRATGDVSMAQSAAALLDSFTRTFVGYSGRLGRRQAGALEHAIPGIDACTSHRDLHLA